MFGRKSPCPRRAPMGYVSVGHWWDWVAMDILDMSLTTNKGNRSVLVIVDCFSRWTEACPLPNKTAVAVADYLSVWNAGCDTFRSGSGIRESSDAGTVPLVGGS